MLVNQRGMCLLTLVKPKVLVCAFSDVQFRALVHNVPFFHAAQRHEVLKRIYEPGDLLGLAPSIYLYLLPDWQRGTKMPEAVHAYWLSCNNPLLEIPENRLLGKVPFVPPADAPWSNLYRPKQYVEGLAHNSFPDFPRYFGRKEREVPDDFHQQFQQEPIMPTGPQRVTASGKVVDA